jgi:DNA-binding beta-propeller fold protein YncE
MGTRSAAAFCFCVCLLAACGGGNPPGAQVPIRIIGERGNGEGRFVTPRGAAVDSENGWLYVVDKTGRIQKFDVEGRYLLGWIPPGGESGRPTALAVDPEGFVWVANTHDHQVLQYTPEGRMVASWGSEGREPGQFIYPVGILIHGGEIIVGEYGGNDRIQVFDRSGRLLRAFGSYGDREGEFKRPQGLAIGPDGLLYVADAANHRVQAFTLEGRFVRAWGKLGPQVGELMYPYGLAFAPDGNLLVCEYGTHRIQKFTPDGRWLSVEGGLGTEPGRLTTPWFISLGAEGRLFVVDMGNHRVQVWPVARLDSRTVSATCR